MVRNIATRRDRSIAGYWDNPGNHWSIHSALVHLFIRVHWEGHASPFRSASAIGHTRTLSLRAKPYVHRCRISSRRAGLYYESFFLLSSAGVFLLVCHLFVIRYEELTLRRTFGDEYEECCRKVRRWWPVIRTQEIQIHKVYSTGHYHCERDWEKL